MEIFLTIGINNTEVIHEPRIFLTIEKLASQMNV